MSYIPDTRHKKKIDIYGHQTDELNPYWYRILEKNDEEYLMGYDWAVDFIINSLDDLLDSAIDILKSEADDHYKTIDEKKKEITDLFAEWLEGHRDELVVSMLDNMEQADYDRRFEEVKDRPEDPEDKWEE